MKTIGLTQGDFTLAPGGYTLISGTSKIYQDLSLALREAYGGDSFHPRWGSLLQNMVGGPLTAETRQQVLVEINRVINNYITVQNAQIIQDNATGSVSRTTTDDVVKSINSITLQQIYDAVTLKVSLQTISRQQVNLTQVIG